MDDPLYLSHNALKAGFLSLLTASKSVDEKLKPFLSDANLSLPHYRILLCLSHYQPISKSALGRKLCLHKQTLHDSVEILDKKNYIRRMGNPKDKRVHLLQLTDEGEAVFNALFKSCASVMQQAFQTAGQQAVQGYKIVTNALSHS